MTLELDTGDDADSTGLSLDTDDDTEATSDLDLDLDLDIGEDSTPTPAATDEDVPEIDMESTVELPKSKLDMATGAAADDDDDKTVFVPKSGSPQQSQEDEVSTKLDLAKAYVELGDSESAKNILQEIMDEGTEEQKQQAQDLLNEV